MNCYQNLRYASEDSFTIYLRDIDVTLSEKFEKKT